MKYSELLLFFMSLYVFHSCTTDEPDEIVTVEIRSNELYTQFLGYHPIEGGYTIAKQAKHFILSEIVSDISQGISYHYKSQEDFKGTNEVEIHKFSSIGVGENSRTTILIRLIVE